MVLEKSERQNEFIENMVIIGSGPAGYTAAIYAARANLKPVLITGFESGGIPGGQLMTTTFVENFPGFPDGVSGPELMDRIKSQAIKWGTELIEADAEEIDLSTRPFKLKADGNTIKSHSLIIATGARANRLGLPNEERFWSRGISACAICDGATPQFRKEELAVIGGGDSACEEAVYLTKYGSRVHLIVRSKHLKASAAMAERVMSNKMINIHWETKALDVNGNGWLQQLHLIERNTKQERKLKVKGLFYAIGHTPNTELVATQLELKTNGYIHTKPGRPETSIKGVFAAGDVCDSEWRQGITAAASGCQAALAAEQWLTRNSLAKLIDRDEKIESNPSPPENTEITLQNIYDPKALWQKGGFALRKLYHESTSPLLVVYTSPNCGPCHILKPQLKRVIEDLKGLAKGIEINIESDQEIAKKAGINGTPTVQLFQHKVLKNQWQGVKQRSIFKEAINQLLKNK